jgi:hypothetical protein
MGLPSFLPFFPLTASLPKKVRYGPENLPKIPRAGGPDFFSRTV